MTKEIKQILFLIIIVITLGSCKMNYGLKTYVYDNEINFDTINKSNAKTLRNFYTRKSIIIINDSTLEYSIRLGHIKTGTTINYRIKNNILKVDTIDIHNRNSFQDYTNEIFGGNFLFSKNSLIDKSNGEKYNLTKRKK
jgi:hypothetical protein